MKINAREISAEDFNRAFSEPLDFGDDAQLVAISRLLYPEPDAAIEKILASEVCQDFTDDLREEVRKGNLMPMWARYGTAQESNADYEAGEEMWVLGSRELPYAHPVWAMEIGWY